MRVCQAFPDAFKYLKIDQEAKKEMSDPMDSLSAAKSFLKQKPFEPESLKKYVEVVHKFRQWLKPPQAYEPGDFEPNYLATAAEENLDSAKLVLSSRLCQFIDAKAKVDIYIAHSKNKEFQDFATQGEIDYRSTLIYITKENPLYLKLVSQDHILVDILEAQIGASSKMPEYKKQQININAANSDVRLLIENKRDPWEVLGVKRDAEESAIRKAFREKARVMHPDKNPGDKDVAEKFKYLNAAMSVLLSSTLKKEYLDFENLPKISPRVNNLGR